MSVSRSPLTAKERDEIVESLKALMVRFRIMPGTVLKLARIAAREAGL